MLSSVQREVPTPEVPVVLVVEDNPVECALVSRILSNAGFQVVSVDCGEKVLDRAIEHSPDLILLDALLPDIDGFEVCQALRRHPSARFTPVVMLTGLDDVTSIDRAYEVGATDFITKPINHSLLVHRIRYLLRARGMMDELRRSRQSLASAQKVAKLGHWELHIEKQRATFSEELCQLYQLDLDRPNPNGYQPLLDVCHSNDRAALERAISAAIKERTGSRVEHRIEYADGSERVVEMHLAVVPDEDGSNHLLGIGMDVTVRKETEREMLRLAYFDRLTGLPSRSMLELVLDQEIPRAHLNGQTVTLVYIDLDLFSRVNNAMGHSAGDAVLRQVAARLGRLVTAPTPQYLLERLSLTMELSGDWCGGLVARLGADTFAVLLTANGDAEERARELASAARQLFQQPFLYRGQEVFVTASLGTSRSDSANCPAEMLLQQADMALREAKQHGRNDVREYHRGLVTRVSAQMSIQSDLRKAIRRGEFMVYYQPKVATRTGAVTGFEALIRWQHPTRGRVSPGEFVNVAEETGQIVEIGRWVLQAACYQFRLWLERGLVDGRIAVNLSARQFREPNLTETVLTALQQSGLEAKYLELEITEGILMSDPRASDIIAELRDHGISIALDDFGTGYSSLSYLTQFPIDTLKIDRSFVTDIAYESEQAAIVTAVTSLSHRLNLKVVAEGIETEAEWQVISDLSCDEVQGFLICKPLPANEIEQWLQASPFKLRSAW
jgi:predicted signal transduction protein with EAL and GGDEF domain/DNA-binding response OmpR family regulator